MSLIAAAGALPVRLRSVAGKPTARADRIRRVRAFAPELRIIVERWLAGELDYPERGDIFAHATMRRNESITTCANCSAAACAADRARCCLTWRTSRGQRASSTAASRHAGSPKQLGVKDAGLASAVQRVARRGALLADVRSRRHASAPLPGSIAWRIHHAAACDWREEFDDATRRWIASAPVLSMPRRIVLAGDPPPDDSVAPRGRELQAASVVLELTESIHGERIGKRRTHGRSRRQSSCVP